MTDIVICEITDPSVIAAAVGTRDVLYGYGGLSGYQAP